MGEKYADRLELETGCMSISFDAPGLFVFFEPGYKKRIAIAGIHGITDINKEQALALADGLKSIAEEYMTEVS